MIVLLMAAFRTLLTGVLAELALRLFRVQHPVFRKAVWACVLVAGFAMPLLQARSILIRVPLFHTQETSYGMPWGVSTDLQAFSAQVGDHAFNVVDGKHEQLHLPSPATSALTVYLLLTVVLILRIAIGLWTAFRVLTRSIPFHSAEDSSVRLSPEIKTPWTFGSSILLPSEAAGWDDEQLRLVLAHESSHVRQYDFYLQLAARVYAAIFWFSPLGWWLKRECERLGEQTSDRAALSVTNSSYLYADLLLRFSTDSTLPAVCMARRSGVRSRIESILAHDSWSGLFERSRRAAVCAVCIVALSVAAGNLGLKGQTSADAGELTKPTVPFQTYDVISVKPNKSGSGGMDIDSDESTFRATNISLKNLLTNAYSIRPSLISGLPKWADNARYDINAKVSEPNPTFKNRILSDGEGEAVWRAKTLALLVDRFHVKAHFETVTAPVYDMVLLPGGPKFSASTLPASQEGMSASDTTLAGKRIPLKSFCFSLEDRVQRNIIDKTGLTGVYDMKLSFTPDEQANTAKDSGISNPPPDIYTALQEQLGLKLVPAKGPVRKLVVDSIEPPAAN